MARIVLRITCLSLLFNRIIIRINCSSSLSMVCNCGWRMASPGMFSVSTSFRRLSGLGRFSSFSKAMRKRGCRCERKSNKDYRRGDTDIYSCFLVV